MTYKHQGKQCERHGAQHAKEMVGRQGQRTGKVPGAWRRGSGAVVGVCLGENRKERCELIYDAAKSIRSQIKG